MVYSAAYLIIILVHAGIIPLQDEFLLKVHITLILDVFREPLLRAVEKRIENKHVFIIQQN